MNIILGLSNTVKVYVNGKEEQQVTLPLFSAGSC